MLVVRRRRGAVGVEHQGAVVIPVAEHGEPDDEFDLVARSKCLELLREPREIGRPDVDDLLRQQHDLRAGPGGFGDHRTVALDDRRSCSVRPARVVRSLRRQHRDPHGRTLGRPVQPDNSVQTGASGNNHQDADRQELARSNHRSRQQQQKAESPRPGQRHDLVDRGNFCLRIRKTRERAMRRQRGNQIIQRSPQSRRRKRRGHRVAADHKPPEKQHRQPKHSRQSHQKHQHDQRQLEITQQIPRQVGKPQQPPHKRSQPGRSGPKPRSHHKHGNRSEPGERGDRVQPGPEVQQHTCRKGRCDRDPSRHVVHRSSFRPGGGRGCGRLLPACRCGRRGGVGSGRGAERRTSGWFPRCPCRRGTGPGRCRR